MHSDRPPVRYLIAVSPQTEHTARRASASISDNRWRTVAMPAPLSDRC
jgi:hypothetical protein